MAHPRGTTTIAIFGGNPVVDNALCVLLRGEGYEVRVLEPPHADPTGEPLAGVDLLLLAPSLDSETCAELLGAVRGNPGTARMPVLVLCAEAGEISADKRSVPVAWPVQTEQLVQKIEAALEGPR